MRACAGSVWGAFYYWTLIRLKVTGRLISVIVGDFPCPTILIAIATESPALSQHSPLATSGGSGSQHDGGTNAALHPDTQWAGRGPLLHLLPALRA